MRGAHPERASNARSSAAAHCVGASACSSRAAAAPTRSRWPRRCTPSRGAMRLTLLLCIRQSRHARVRVAGRMRRPAAGRATFGLPLDVIAACEARAQTRSACAPRAMRALLAAAKREVAASSRPHITPKIKAKRCCWRCCAGAGSAGLGGMRARRPLEPGVDLARPMLRSHFRGSARTIATPKRCRMRSIRRTRIAELRRNAVREALEALRPLFPGLDRAVARAAELVREERDATRRARASALDSRAAGGRGRLARHRFRARRGRGARPRKRQNRTFHMKPGIALRIERGSIAGIKRE